MEIVSIPVISFVIIVVIIITAIIIPFIFRSPGSTSSIVESTRSTRPISTSIVAGWLWPGLVAFSGVTWRRSPTRSVIVVTSLIYMTAIPISRSRSIAVSWRRSVSPLMIIGVWGSIGRLRFTISLVIMRLISWIIRFFSFRFERVSWLFKNRIYLRFLVEHFVDFF